MHVRTLAAAPIAACVLGLAACGGGSDGGAAASQSPERKLAQAQLKFAQCMREQGIDFPDPESGGAGLVKVGGDATPDELREAEQACAKLRDDTEPPELSEAEQQEFKDAALAHARCMREQGIDFPDPTFSEDGGAQVRLGAGRVNTEDAELKEAEKQCAGKLGPIVERRP